MQKSTIKHQLIQRFKIDLTLPSEYATLRTMKPPSKQRMTEYEVTVPVITFHSVELEAESEEQAIVILKLALGHHDNNIENLIKAEPGQF